MPVIELQPNQQSQPQQQPQHDQSHPTYFTVSFSPTLPASKWHQDLVSSISLISATRYERFIACQEQNINNNERNTNYIIGSLCNSDHGVCLSIHDTEEKTPLELEMVGRVDSTNQVIALINLRAHHGTLQLNLADFVTMLPSLSQPQPSACIPVSIMLPSHQVIADPDQFTIIHRKREYLASWSCEQFAITFTLVQ